MVTDMEDIVLLQEKKRINRGLMVNSNALFKGISRFIGQFENRLSEFNEITAIGFVIADLV